METMNLGGDCFRHDWLATPNSINGVTNTEQVKEMPGTLYDSAHFPPITIFEAINKGLIQLNKGDTLRGWDFSMPKDQEITIPDGVTLEDCSVSSGRVLFPCGDCTVIGPDGVAIATGAKATAIAIVAGGYVFAAAAGATAIPMVADSFAYGTAAGSIVLKYNDDAHVTTFEELQHLEQRAKDDADNEQDWRAAHRFALTSLLKIYESSYPKEVAFHYLQMASEHGHADASYFLGKIFFTGEYGVIPRFKLAEAFLDRAHEQGHKDAMYTLGQLHSSAPHQIVELEDRYTINSAIAHNCYRIAAENGHLLAQGKVAEYEANNGSEIDMHNLVSTLESLRLSFIRVYQSTNP